MDAVEMAEPISEAVVATGILRAAADAGVTLRLTGGVAVSARSPSALRAPLRRAYGDIDFVAASRDAHALGELMPQLGFAADDEFNLLHGQRRLYFRDERGFEADVFLDRIEACHTLELRDRLTIADRTLAPADLLLSKLQVVETNHKDYQDALALLVDHDLTPDEQGISLPRMIEVCAADWGWWRTVTMVAGRAREAAAKLAAESDEETRAGLTRADERLQTLIEELDATPKSRRWKMRAKVGDRKRWYELPEDIEHDDAPA
jgi:hypothetical protein